MPPTSFENLIYDLASSAGLRNAVWRTPGSDEGRDIEGEITTIDFSGYYAITKWYIECKRYSTSVDWPTVWQKIAYADSHGADYLLIVTTAHLSPQCKTEISRWHADRRRPAIRVWDAANLEQILLQHPRVLIKYGLSADQRMIAPSFLSLASQTSKVVQAAYGTAEMSGQHNAALDAASALSELLTVRMEDAEAGTNYTMYPFVLAEDAYDWLKIDGELGQFRQFDRYGLRAILALTRHISGLRELAVTKDGSTLHLSVADGRQPNATAIEFLVEVAMWGDLEILIDGANLTISSRNADESE